MSFIKIQQKINFILFISIVYHTIPTLEFNLSPKPNLIFKDPNLKTYMTKIRSSYFGFSIVLRENSIIIGAPQAQSVLESQRHINETGAIYKCLIDTQLCFPFIFDNLGNIISETNEYTYDSEKKDYQWLGMSMDGGPKETDRLVVCAPRLVANLQSDYLMHGICFWTNDTTGNKPTPIKKISPLRLKSEQVKEFNNTRYFYYMFGEQGISVHITENNEEIIVGAPGVFTWKGTIIRYSAKEKEDVGGLSRRESIIRRPGEWEKLRSIQNKRDGVGVLKDKTIEYISEILNPGTWGQTDDSYFGYSVTSGFFDIQANRKQILYLASAPQANKQQGEVYLFDIVKTYQGLSTIRKYYTFHGRQFGEYFGYSLLAEDLNGDGMTDVIITAPLHSVDHSYEKGAIYVFMNKGKVDFEDAKVITTKTDTPDRFGTTITKLGDINHDGYNDIAVGAPFQDDGAVYVFLGGKKGLREKPSQILKFPKPNNDSNKQLKAMFGHGLSKGFDIDGNSYNDLAIGAPNSEVVYLFKSYPIVSIIGSIKASSREIKIDQKQIQLNVSYYINSITESIDQQDIIIKLKADLAHKRVQFTNTKSNEMIIIATATRKPEFRLIDATIKFNVATIFKPLKLEMHYELKNDIYNNNLNTSEIEDFCDTCTVTNPSDSMYSEEIISFNTGCENECVADLKIKSSGLSSPFVIGSENTISINYEITNEGENAYLPQINITSSNHMPFIKIPSNCELNDFTMICNLRILPMESNDKEFITIVFDSRHIEGDTIKIQAEVTSAGEELNPHDNIVLDSIELIEKSDLEIQAFSRPSTINLEDKPSGIIKVTNTYEIRNYGPSRIKEMNLTVSIPISFNPNSNSKISIIDIESVNVNVIYHERLIPTDFYQNNIILLPNSIEKSSKLDSMVEDVKKIEYQWEQQSKHENDGLSLMREKRNINNENDLIYTQSLRKDKLLNLIGASLPINKTNLFHCDNSNNNIICMDSITKINDFEANHNAILNITIQYDLNLTEINSRILFESMEFLVITNNLELNKANMKTRDILNIKKVIAHNIIMKHRIQSTPIWIYVVSILSGIILLAAIIYGFYKYGFFKRTKKEELNKLIRQSKIQQNDDNIEDEQPLQK